MRHNDDLAPAGSRLLGEGGGRGRDSGGQEFSDGIREGTGRGCRGRLCLRFQGRLSGFRVTIFPDGVVRRVRTECVHYCTCIVFRNLCYFGEHRGIGNKQQCSNDIVLKRSQER